MDFKFSFVLMSAKRARQRGIKQNPRAGGLEVFWRHGHVDIPLPNLGELKNLHNLKTSASSC